jgi:hypothetical protein
MAFNLETAKTITEIAFYVVATGSAFLAIRTYQENQSLERSRWASSLYEKFYEEADLKGVRRDLDSSPDSPDVLELVQEESPDFPDYLNFFEHVAYLVKCKQIKSADANAYFAYYFECLKRHPAVWSYVRNESNGYEMLAEYLGK